MKINSTALVNILRVTCGNFLEMFDFFLFGFYATHIAKTFFPAENDFASLMLTFAVFGAGFLMRPLGAIVLGSYIDLVGRRKGLVVTLGIMAMGTLLVAFVPGYRQIGILAPFLVLVGRLLQGFSAGVELGGVSVYLAEIATPKNRGFYVSWQSASQQLAIVLAAAIGYGLNLWLMPSQVAEWGWRIPFLIGCGLIPFLFYIRRSLQETPEFSKRKNHAKVSEIVQSMVANWQIVGIGLMLVTMTTVSFYMITVYTPTFGKSVLKLDETESLLITFCIGLSNFIFLPLMGAVSDRLGRLPVLLVSCVVAILTVYPSISWLVSGPSFGRMLIVELWLSAIYGSYNGAMVVALTEIMPPQVRTVGFSLAYSLATAIFGGFTPAICTLLIQYTGDKASPGLWMSGAAVTGLVATLLIWKRVKLIEAHDQGWNAEPSSH